MNIYVIETYGYYAVGIAIVAANDKNHAKKVASNIEIANPYWQIKYLNADNVELLPATYNGKKAVVLFHSEYGE